MVKSMEWYQLADNPQAVTQLFSVPPALQAVALSSVTLDWRGPMAILRGGLTQFPAHPPQRWVDAGYNAVSIELSLGELYAIEITRWGYNIIVDINIEQNDDGYISFVIDSETCIIHAKTKSFRITRLSGYTLGSE